MQRGEVRNPVQVLVLVLVTCGIYGIIYFFKMVEDINKGLGREEFDAGKELLLSIVTCGVWGYYFMWRASEALVELQRSWGVEPVMDAPILFVTNLIGLGPLFIQQSLNNAWENGTPGGTGHGGGGGVPGGGGPAGGGPTGGGPAGGGPTGGGPGGGGPTGGGPAGGGPTGGGPGGGGPTGGGSPGGGGPGQP